MLKQLSKTPFSWSRSQSENRQLGNDLRSSDAVKVDGVLVCDRCTDIFNPNVVRASVGTLFTIPVIEASGKETPSWLKKNKIQILAATPSATAEYTEVDMRGPLGIAVGTEQLGLSKLWMAEADHSSPHSDVRSGYSLNVAMATTLLYTRPCDNAEELFPMLEVLYVDNHVLLVNKLPALPTSPSPLLTKAELLCKEWVKEQYQKPGNVFACNPPSRQAGFWNRPLGQVKR